MLGKLNGGREQGMGLAGEECDLRHRDGWNVTVERLYRVTKLAVCGLGLRRQTKTLIKATPKQRRQPRLIEYTKPTLMWLPIIQKVLTASTTYSFFYLATLTYKLVLRCDRQCLVAVVVETDEMVLLHGNLTVTVSNLFLFEGCGGPLLGSSGVIRYPQEEGKTYPHSRDCAWVINTAPDKVRPWLQVGWPWQEVRVEYRA